MYMEGIVKVEGYAPVANKSISIVKAVEAFLSECDIRANSKNVYRTFAQLIASFANGLTEPSSTNTLKSPFFELSFFK